MGTPRPIGPKAGIPPEMITPLAILGIIWGGAALVLALWALGGLASLIATGQWAAPPLEFETLPRVFDRGPERVFKAPLWLLIAFWGGLALLLTVLYGWWVARRAALPDADDAVRSLAKPEEIYPLTPEGVEKRARQLRPSLAGQKNVHPNETGMLLGELLPNGPDLRASLEDTMLCLMAPRSGKTTSIAVPSILNFPSDASVLATSNKPDLVASTIKARSQTGTVYVFDPQAVALAPRRFVFDPLRWVNSVEDAHRLAMHFIQEIRGESSGSSGDFWQNAAGDHLMALILAASVSGRHLGDVYGWLNDPASRTPAHLLRENGYTTVAAAYEGRAQGAPDTYSGIVETARTAALSLRDEGVLEWVTPQPGMPQLNPHEFIAKGGDTVYAMSKDGGGSAAPLVAALCDALFRAAMELAEANAGRLDPPFLAVLDEAANVAKLEQLPQWMSWFGSKGILVQVVLQSYEQGKSVWGATGMEMMYGSTTVKMFGSGLDDANLVRNLSELVGEHDVTTRSTSHGRESSSSLSTRRQRILPPEAIRALPRGTALLLATGTRPALIRLKPWYEGPNAAEISKAIKSAEAAIQKRAEQQRQQRSAAEQTQRQEVS